MVRAWYITDERQPCDGRSIDVGTVFKKTGVSYYSIDASNHETDPTMSDLKRAKKITNFDIIEIGAKDPMLTKFYTEHLHDDEEIRAVLDGSGYFDVRDTSDNWIRVQVEKGDAIVVPCGIYHRFSLTQSKYAQLLRLFSESQGWYSYKRPEDGNLATNELSARQKYMDYMQTISNAA